MAKQDTMQQCPRCKEWIPMDTRRCGYCRELIEDEESPRRKGERTSAIQREEVRRPLRANEREDWDDEPEYRDRPRRSRRMERGAYADCPNCGCAGFADKVAFTWWGGVIGPAIICHVRCQKCRRCYNGRTGNDNTMGIVIYTVVGAAITISLIILILGFGFFFG